jgi:hypothetical protein
MSKARPQSAARRLKRSDPNRDELRSKNNRKHTAGRPLQYLDGKLIRHRP